MSAHIAQFKGGPAHGTIRTLPSDTWAEDPKDREFPALVEKVASLRDGEMRMESYLRSKDPLSNGHWVYTHVPSEN